MTSFPNDISPLDGKYLYDADGRRFGKLVFNVGLNQSIFVGTVSIPRANDSTNVRVFSNNQQFNFFIAGVDIYLSATFNLRSDDACFLFRDQTSNVNTSFIGNRSFFIRNLRTDIGSLLRIENSQAKPFYFYLSNIQYTTDTLTLDTFPAINAEEGNIPTNFTFSDLIEISSADETWQIVTTENTMDIQYFIEEADGDKVFLCKDLLPSSASSLVLKSLKKISFELKIRWSIENDDILTINKFSYSGGNNIYFNGDTLSLVLDIDETIEITFTKNSVSDTNLNQVYFYLLNISQDLPILDIPTLITKQLDIDNISYFPSGTNYQWTLKYLQDVKGNRFTDDNTLDNNTLVFSCDNLLANSNSSLIITPAVTAPKYFSAILYLRYSSELKFDFLRIFRNGNLINYYSGINGDNYMGVRVYLDNISQQDNLRIEYIKDVNADAGLDSVYFYFSEIEFSDDLIPSKLMKSQIIENDIIYQPFDNERWIQQKVPSFGTNIDNRSQVVYLCDGLFNPGLSGLTIAPNNNLYLSVNILIRLSLSRFTDNGILYYHRFLGTSSNSQIFAWFSPAGFAGFATISQIITNITTTQTIDISVDKQFMTSNPINSFSSITSSNRDNSYFYFNNLRFTINPLSPLINDYQENEIIYSPQETITLVNSFVAQQSKENTLNHKLDHDPNDKSNHQLQALNSSNWYRTTLNTIPFIDDQGKDIFIFTCIGLSNSQISSMNVNPITGKYLRAKLNLRWSTYISSNSNYLIVAINETDIIFRGDNLEGNYYGTSVFLENISSNNVLKISYQKNTFINNACDAIYFYLTDIEISDTPFESIFIDNLMYQELQISGDNPRRWLQKELGEIKYPPDNIDQQVFFCDGFFELTQTSSSLTITIPENKFLNAKLALRWSLTNNIENLIIQFNDQSPFTFSGNNSPDYQADELNILNFSGTIIISLTRTINSISRTRGNAYFFFDNFELLDQSLPEITEPIILDNNLTLSPGGQSNNWIQVDEDNYAIVNLDNNTNSCVKLTTSSQLSIILQITCTIVEPDYFNLYQNGIKIARFSNNTSISLFFDHLNVNPLTLCYERTSTINNSNGVFFTILQTFDRKINKIPVLPSSNLNKQTIDVSLTDGIFEIIPQSDDNLWQIICLDENRFLCDKIGEKVILSTLPLSSSSSSLKIKILPVLEDSSSFKTLNLRWSINGNSSVECKKGDNIIFKENYSQNAYPNNGFNGISIPIQLNEDDEYLFTYNRETFNNDNFPITGTFNTFYFFFNDNNTLNTGPILMTFKNFTGISANNLISSNSNIRYRNQILYSNNNPTLNAEPLFISGQVIDNNIN